MDIQPNNPAVDIFSALNMFAQSTGDYYIFYDFENDLIHFSDNILSAGDFFAINKKSCSLSEWRNYVNPHDIHRLSKAMADMISGESPAYNLNYRVQNAQGQTEWINSRGNAYYRPNGQIDYILGRLSVGDSSKQVGTFSNKELKREIRRRLDTLQPGYLLLMGVDNLKTINMKNGRNFGDAVLSDVARVIEDETHRNNTVYRINGDWFAVNLATSSQNEVSEVFSRIQERLSGQCTISGGCVSYTDYHVADEGMLLQYAEISLDYSKTHGKNILTFFTPENYESKLRELELREDLKKSIEEDFDGFELFYQGQVYSETYELYGAEALLRYRSPRLGNISPLEFIPILEQSNLMYPVGLWVIRQALKTCREWRDRLPDFHISINMSYAQLEQSSIEEDILDIVKSSGVPGSALTIEVTESMEFSNYPQLNNYFRRWKNNGIEISVDDFGTGYSSLSRLKDMAIDEIKIDRYFVKEIQNSAYNYRLLSNIIELAGSSRIRVCCEGVETLEELNALMDLHPTLIQGFLFSKPYCAKEFEKRFIAGNECDQTRKKVMEHLSSVSYGKNTSELSTDEIADAILNAEDDIIYLCGIDTYELYYLNPAGQQLFGVKDYCGKKCYKVFHGKDTPCEFCNNNMLRRDSFYIWENKNEYCGRHFLLKDKLVRYKNKNVRLEVGVDITKQEFISQSARERLEFADKTVEYMNTLSATPDYNDAVNRVLALLGDFYQADRAYLFEPSPVHSGCWNNTYEWCALNTSSELENLQEIPPEAIQRWMDIFDEEQSVIILNLDPLKAQSPLEWQNLSVQGIQRLISVPIRENGKTIAFLGVDNPRYCIHDDSQLRVLAAFLLTRMRQDQNEHRYQMFYDESNLELLSALNVGFWTLDIDKKTDIRQMIFDDTMCRILSAPELASPGDRYEYMFSRVQNKYRENVKSAFINMIDNNRIVQVEFPWEHPGQGEIKLRLSGLLIENTAHRIKFKGYCRLLLGKE